MRILLCLLIGTLFGCGGDSTTKSNNEENLVSVETMRSAGIDIGLKKGYYKLSKPQRHPFLYLYSDPEANDETTFTHFKIEAPSSEDNLDIYFETIIFPLMPDNTIGIGSVVWLRDEDNTYFYSLGAIPGAHPYGDCNDVVLDVNLVTDIYLFGLCRPVNEIVGLNEYGFSYILGDIEASTLTFTCSSLDGTFNSDTNSTNIADMIYNPYADHEKFKEEAKALCQETDDDTVTLDVEAQTLYIDYLWEYDAEFTAQMEALEQEQMAQ